MGKQVNFYMTDDDEREFVEFARSSTDVVIFMDVQTSEDIAILGNLPTPETPGWFGLCLWNKECSPPPKLKYIKEQCYYSVDKLESEVVEFHRSHMNEGRLVRGRIFAEMSYWRLSDKPPTVVKKSEAFVKWYDRLANWIKRRSTRNAVGDFMLPGAAIFAAKGGQHCQVVFANGKAI